ncbi:transferase, Chloramphenicol acetyltransferase-like domain protein [Artemisia annua]|uniref:Transferase, Chloramphenicol acetyltransferase-like domain protein n=1 Tax=Artemisia annua TaxID=35608 RepID=A0A2U1PAS0_ARTAN|nr:transferase, Chloramphenicol acetyltransferase-like domain protein [Artemisia annua]
MTMATVRRISECFVKPLHDLSQEAKQPIYFSPFELLFLNANYSQKGLLFAKPTPTENQDFSISTFLDDLRGSLSATLDHFYPLAARLATRKQENPPSYVVYIDPENCQGVKFVHATVDATVEDIIASKDVHILVHSFFDLNNAINHDGHTLPLLSIQVTELTDGIFIGGSVNHLLADGTSFWHFMATWSEIFRSNERDGYSISRPPIFKKWVLEGSDPIINLPYTHEEQFIERFESPKVRERFFHFSSASVAKLKARANAECNTNKISSLQAVSAFIWKCVTRVRRQPNKSETICRLVVSNRSRVNPPMTENYFGNPIQSVSATTTVEELMVHGLGWAALKLHEAIKSHDDTAVKKLVESWLRNPIVYKLSGLFHPNLVHFGSSPRFDMYGCEFGLGKALAARSGFVNKADGKMTMYPGREGGGSMDVEVCLLPVYMMELERDEEFICALESN